MAMGNRDEMGRTEAKMDKQKGGKERDVARTEKVTMLFPGFPVV
jgi:hypothetical protein